MDKKYLDKKIPFEERKKNFKREVTDKMMNPFSKNKFRCSSFDPQATGAEEEKLAQRERKIPQKKLRTYGLKPKEIRVGQMIGMYESKQDLYLIFAHRCNEMQKEIDTLKEKITELENK